METITFRIPKRLKEKFKKKAGLIDISKILRIFVERYVKGEINIDND